MDANPQDPAGACREAVIEIEKALQLPRQEVGRQVDHILRLVVSVRDGLIEQMHQDGGRPDLRPALDRVNAALSLIAAVEYPAAGVQRKPLEQARDALQGLLDDLPGM